MRKIAINNTWGGFRLSDAAVDMIKQCGVDTDCWCGLDRDNPYLIQVLEQLGVFGSKCAGEISIVEIPEDVSWHIEEYDGQEHVAEDHRTWYPTDC